MEEAVGLNSSQRPREALAQAREDGGFGAATF